MPEPMFALETAVPAETLEALHARYHALVLRTAYLILGDWGHAEDVAQEVWLQVGRSPGAYDPGRGAVTTWLHHVTVSRCLNLRRRLVRWLGAGIDRELADRAPPPLDQALRDEEQRRIWAAVARLPLKLRAAVVLRYFHDLRYDEIAQALGCPVGTVRSRLHNAHERLRALLADSQIDG